MSLFRVARSNEGLGELYSTMLTATILTFFEIVFFFTVIAPGIDKSIDTSLNAIAETISCNVLKGVATYFPKIQDSALDILVQKGELTQEDKKKVLKQMVMSDSPIIRKLLAQQVDESQKKWLYVLQTLSDRETLLTDKINKYTKYTGIIIITMMVGGLLSIRSRSNVIRPEHVQNSVFTVIMLIGFQYSSYLLGQEYKYTGTNAMAVAVTDTLLD